jgi:hypothetical protein
MNTFDILPAQKEPTEGWEIEYSFLRAVEDGVRDRGESIHLEAVEAVLLTAFDLLSVYFPNGLEART